MAAEYDFRKNPKGKEEESELTLHPRIVSKGTIDSKRIARDLTHATTFTEGDVIGLLAALENNIADYLKEGYEVKLGDMGYFSLRLKSRPVKNPKEIRAASVSIDNINFRANTIFKRNVKGAELIRAKRGFVSSGKITQDECREKLLVYLNKNTFITRSTYSRITGLLKNKALNSLNEFVKEGFLIKEGKGSHVFYMRNKEIV